jgi:methionyl-tRNA formyltransferase
MGTPDFAVPALKALAESEHKVAGVLCQPDRAAGRGNKMKACAVKEAALVLGIPVFQPERVRLFQGELTELAPECIVVAAYGQILPEWVLELPAFGCINIHASLLPAYRGAAPVHRAVMNGDTVTGVSIMRMDAGLDTGGVLAAEKIAVGPDATMGDIHDDLARLGAALLLETLSRMETGDVEATPQPEGATYAAKIEPDDEIILWSRPATEIHNRIRGLNPWPGARTSFRGDKVKVWASRLVDPHMADLYKLEKGSASEEQAGAQDLPGSIAGVSVQGLYCRTGNGLLEILQLQPAGKKTMSGRDFYNGRVCEPGEGFGDGVC